MVASALLAALLGGCEGHRRALVDEFSVARDKMRNSPRETRVVLPPPKSLEGTSRSTIEDVLGPPLPCLWLELRMDPERPIVGVGFIREVPLERCARYEFNELRSCEDCNQTLEIKYENDRCSGARWTFGFVSFRDGWHRPEAVVY
jgi:hypothetical protein